MNIRHPRFRSFAGAFGSDNASPRAVAVPESPLNSDLVGAVNQFHQSLYRFAFCLTFNQRDAVDLTRRSYQALVATAAGIRDSRETKLWLFTTLYRQFQETVAPLPHLAVESAEPGSGKSFITALGAMDGKLRGPLALFYLQGFSHEEIAAVLDLPLGTTMMRLFRGKELLGKPCCVAAQLNERISPLKARIAELESQLNPLS